MEALQLILHYFNLNERYITETERNKITFKFRNNIRRPFAANEGNEKLTNRKLKSNDEKIGSTYMEGAVEWRVKYL